MIAPRPLRRATLALALLVAVGCGGGDEAVDDTPVTPPEPGEEVGGRAPGTEPDPVDDDVDAGDDDGPGPLAEVAVTVTSIAQVDRPNKLVARPGSTLLYVAQQDGTILSLDPATGTTAPALDLTDVTRNEGEQGLLGLAFSLDGATLFVHHSGRDGETRVARFAMDGDTVDAGSRTDLLTLEQPYPNHNGGDLVVDEDGLLWIGLGDGGSGGDPENRSQDPDELLGKLLRIDPDGGDGDRAYGIPTDNPFADGGGRPEIAVMGVRNPWRFRFDPATGDLWVADVGQDRWEEITRVPADEVLGANLGWPRYEGSETYDDGRELHDDSPLGPVYELSHDDEWCSISGGVVYRGSAIPDLDGAFLFSDYCRPGLASIRLGDDGVVAETVVLSDAVGGVVSVDTDLDGEVWIVTHDGWLRRLDPA